MKKTTARNLLIGGIAGLLVGYGAIAEKHRVKDHYTMVPNSEFGYYTYDVSDRVIIGGIELPFLDRNGGRRFVSAGGGYDPYIHCSGKLKSNGSIIDERTGETFFQVTNPATGKFVYSTNPDLFKTP